MRREHGPDGSYNEAGPLHRENAYENAIYIDLSAKMRIFLEGGKVPEKDIIAFIQMTEKMISGDSGISDMAKTTMKKTIGILKQKARIKIDPEDKILES